MCCLHCDLLEQGGLFLLVKFIAGEFATRSDGEQVLCKCSFKGVEGLINIFYKMLF